MNLRLVIFVIVSMMIMITWEKIFPQKVPDATVLTAQEVKPTIAINDVPSQITDEILTDVKTNLADINISNVGASIVSIKLLNYENKGEPYQLLLQNAERTFIAQTGLIATESVPNHKTVFTLKDRSESKDKINLNFIAEINGITVIKKFIFDKSSYTINIGYDIINNSNNPLNLESYWRILRDKQVATTKFIHNFAGAVYYDDAFHAIKFDDIATDVIGAKNGWVGFDEHYFIALWMLNANNYPTVCNKLTCKYDISTLSNGLYSAGVIATIPTIAPHNSYSISMPLYAGPQEYELMKNTAPELERTKDYGWVYIFATPLFWMLVHLFKIIPNWGWSIIVLTVILKLLLYPLTRASFLSIARMKSVAPQLEVIKERYKDDKAKLQQSLLELYKTEKINPLGGCLPMLLQIPVFIGLYWALLGSVELRMAKFLWIHDLSSSDPYFIMPIILSACMFLQSSLNPPSADPLQAKMMKFMPLIFSIIFFFFPAGLVLYWIANSLISILQQWYVNKYVVKK